jgi:hypothetical protein
MESASSSRPGAKFVSPMRRGVSVDSNVAATTTMSASVDARSRRLQSSLRSTRTIFTVVVVVAMTELW